MAAEPGRTPCQALPSPRVGSAETSGPRIRSGGSASGAIQPPAWPRFGFARPPRNCSVAPPMGSGPPRLKLFARAGPPRRQTKSEIVGPPVPGLVLRKKGLEVDNLEADELN